VGRLKPVVLRSVEAPDGLRCVDILRREGDFGWVACRRDPEDSHGWRPVGAARYGFVSEAAALAHAIETTGVLTG